MRVKTARAENDHIKNFDYGESSAVHSLASLLQRRVFPCPASLALPTDPITACPHCFPLPLVLAPLAVVVNRDGELDACVAEVSGIIEAEKARVVRRHSSHHGGHNNHHQAQGQNQMAP